MRTVESRPSVKATFLRVATAGSILFVGCGTPPPPSAEKPNSELVPITSPLSLEDQQHYTQLLQDTIGKSCALDLELVQMTPIHQQGVYYEGTIIQPTKPGEKAKIAIPANIPRASETLKAYGVSLEEYNKALRENAVIHEGIHACSTEEPRPNPIIAEYTDPKKYIDKQKGEYTQTLTIKRLDGPVTGITGIILEFTITSHYQNGKTETDPRTEPREKNFEELITHYLTLKELIKQNGADNLAAQIEKRESLFLSGIHAVGVLIDAAKSTDEDILGAKKQKDAKTIFDTLQKGFLNIGIEHGISPLRIPIDEAYRRFIFYKIVNEIEYQRDASKTVLPLIANYFFGKEYNQLSAEDQRKVVEIGKIFTPLG